MEELALQYYAGEEGGGWRGVHRCARRLGAGASMLQAAPISPHSTARCQPAAVLFRASTSLCSEGGIWATLFGLLLWDVLFMPAPDVFRTPFQVG